MTPRPVSMLAGHPLASQPPIQDIEPASYTASQATNQPASQATKQPMRPEIIVPNVSGAEQQQNRNNRN